MFHPSSEEDIPAPIYQHISDSDWQEEEVDQKMDLEKVDLCKLNSGKFILAEFKVGKRNCTMFRYVCLIDYYDVEEEEVKILGLKSTDNSKRNFTVDQSDVSFIKVDQILSILPDPEIKMKGERISYTFEKSISVLET